MTEIGRRRRNHGSLTFPSLQLFLFPTTPPPPPLLLLPSSYYSYYYYYYYYYYYTVILVSGCLAGTAY